MPEELSEGHAADVFRRAALLQARSDHSLGVGLTLDELKRAGEAAGIDGRYVEQAYLGAGEDLAPSPPFLGIETGVRRVRLVPGRVSEQEWGRIVLALRREFGGDGDAEIIGDVREWKHNQTRVQVEPDGSATRITALSEWGSDVKGSSLGGILYAVCAALFATFGAVAGEPGIGALAAFLLVCAVVSAGFAWGPYRKRARTRGPRLDRAIDAVERLVGADERAAAVGTSAPVSDPSGGESVDVRLDPSVTGTPLHDADVLRRSGRLRT